MKPTKRSELSEVYVLEVCTGVGMAGIPRIPREIRRNGDRCCGNTAGIEVAAVGIVCACARARVFVCVCVFFGQLSSGKRPQCGPVRRYKDTVKTRAFQFVIRIDSIRFANRFESILFVKKIGLRFTSCRAVFALNK